MSADSIQRPPGRRRRVPAAPPRTTSTPRVDWSRTATADVTIDVRAIPLRRGGALAWGDDAATRIFQYDKDGQAQWRPGPPLPGPAHGAPGVRLADGSILIVAAQDGKQVWRWAPGLPAFVPMRPLQVPRHGPAVVPSGAHGALVVGGFGLDGGPVAPIEVITPQGSFTRGHLLRPRPEPLAVVVLGEVVILGPSPDEPTEQPEIWPLGMGDGRLGPEAPEPRWGAAAIAYGAGVLRAGGQTAPLDGVRSYLSQCHLYDPSVDEWRSAGRLSCPRARCRLANWGDAQCLIIGGASDHPKVVARVECFDGAGWVRQSTLAVGRIDHDAIALSDGRILVVGGRTLGDVPPPYSELSSLP
ncbi:MAG: hypothetical protein AAF449_06940 [Myxococcota bacterium]